MANGIQIDPLTVPAHQHTGKHHLCGADQLGDGVQEGQVSARHIGQNRSHREIVETSFGASCPQVSRQ